MLVTVSLPLRLVRERRIVIITVRHNKGLRKTSAKNAAVAVTVIYIHLFSHGRTKSLRPRCIKDYAQRNPFSNARNRIVRYTQSILSHAMRLINICSKKLCIALNEFN